MNATRPERPRSLTFRLGWRLSAVVLAAILLTAGLSLWRAIVTVHELDDYALQNQAALVAAALPPASDTAGNVALPEALTARFRASDGDNVFLVFDGMRLVASSDPAEAARILGALGGSPSRGFFAMRSFDGHSHGMIGAARQVGRWRVVVLQGREQTVALLNSLVGNFMLAAIWLLLPIGAVLVIVGVWTLRHGLRPVRRVSAAAAAIGPTRPDARLPTDALPQEIAPLVHAMNDALERLQQALAQQRRFIAEAAHALRTPLSVLTARLDLGEENPEIRALQRDVDRMTRLVGQMLRMARLEGMPVDVSETVDLRSVAVEAIADLVPLGVQPAVEIALAAPEPGPLVRGSHAMLVLAVTNLIENALMHAPSGTAVEVVVVSPAAIAVSDRGPGVAPQDRTRIFDRFERGVSPAYGGAGLGLSIVAGIAALHAGAVAVDDREGGGAVFVLTLGSPIGDGRALPQGADELRPVES